MKGGLIKFFFLVRAPSPEGPEYFLVHLGGPSRNFNGDNDSGSFHFIHRGVNDLSIICIISGF